MKREAGKEHREVAEFESAALSVMLDLDLQNALAQPSDAALPEQAELEQWVSAALQGAMAQAQLTIRLVERTESSALNQAFRDRQGPTNVLSFPFDAPPEVDLPLLGDIVICAPLVVDEATAQGKTERAHWAHLVVHGVLHLRGYDHIDEGDALKMEDLERKIMAYLGFEDPYSE